MLILPVACFVTSVHVHGPRLQYPRRLLQRAAPIRASLDSLPSPELLLGGFSMPLADTTLIQEANEQVYWPIFLAGITIFLGGIGGAAFVGIAADKMDLWETLAEEFDLSDLDELEADYGADLRQQAEASGSAGGIFDSLLGGQASSSEGATMTSPLSAEAASKSTVTKTETKSADAIAGIDDDYDE